MSSWLALRVAEACTVLERTMSDAELIFAVAPSTLMRASLIFCSAIWTDLAKLSVCMVRFLDRASMLSSNEAVMDANVAFWLFTDALILSTVSREP